MNSRIIIFQAPGRISGNQVNLQGKNDNIGKCKGHLNWTVWVMMSMQFLKELGFYSETYMYTTSKY